VVSLGLCAGVHYRTLYFSYPLAEFPEAFFPHSIIDSLSLTNMRKWMLLLHLNIMNNKNKEMCNSLLHQ
jgi:hypothetical protein